MREAFAAYCLGYSLEQGKSCGIKHNVGEAICMYEMDAERGLQQVELSTNKTDSCGISMSSNIHVVHGKQICTHAHTYVSYCVLTMYLNFYSGVPAIKQQYC